MFRRLSTWLRTTRRGEYRLGVLRYDGKTVTNRDLRFRATLRLLWYDFWVGMYWDRDKKLLYVCPLPTVVICIGYQ